MTVTSNGQIIWITGYPNSGKTFIADKLSETLKENFNLMPIRLDGDSLRLLLGKTEIEKSDDRKKLGILYINLAENLAKQGFVVIVSVVAMYKEIFSKLRKLDVPCSLFFLEASYETLLSRDNLKNVYDNNDKASFNEIPSELPAEIIKVSNEENAQPKDVVTDMLGAIITRAESHLGNYHESNSGSAIESFVKSQNKITDYWNQYYLETKVNLEPSSFAIKLKTELLSVENAKILDFGCGDGRDSFYLSKHAHVLGVDISKQAILSNTDRLKIESTTMRTLEFEHLDNNLSTILTDFEPNIFYARFVFHALTEKEEDNVLRTLSMNLKPKSFIALECRTILDPLSKRGVRISKNERVFGHYRRFINESELIRKIKDKGWKINYLESGFDLAAKGDDNPHVLRLVAEVI